MPKSKSSQAPGPFLALMLEKYNLNPFKLSKDIHLSQSAVRLIVLGKNKISVPVAFRLAKYFNTNPEFWLAMQTKWDISEAEKDKALKKIVSDIPRVQKGPAPAKKTAAKKTAKAKKPAKAKKTAKAGKTVKRAAAKKTTARGRKPGRAKKAVAVRRVTRPKKPVAHRKPAPAKKAVRKAARKK